MKKPYLFVRTPGTDDMLYYCGGPHLEDAIRGLENILKCGDADGEAFPIDLEIRQMTDEEWGAIQEV
jgi:hypothetical protein